MKLKFDIEFNLDLLILVICSMYATGKILDALVKEPHQMCEPENIKLDDDENEREVNSKNSEHEVNSDDEV